jgi:hypothetical protein
MPGILDDVLGEIAQKVGAEQKSGDGKPEGGAPAADKERDDKGRFSEKSGKRIHEYGDKFREMFGERKS